MGKINDCFSLSVQCILPLTLWIQVIRYKSSISAPGQFFHVWGQRYVLSSVVGYDSKFVDDNQ